MNKNNIILIGHFCTGKTTIAREITKEYPFINYLDTDDLIISQQNASLIEIINSKGSERFKEIEENIICSLRRVDNYVIATGGSVCYSPKSMKHLSKLGVIFFLDTPLKKLNNRLNNLTDRGVIIKPNQTLEELYNERFPLYKDGCDYVVKCDGKSVKDICKEVVDYYTSI